MSSRPIKLSELTIRGFRAYLEPKTFRFETHQSLAVFAPNGHGKSSIADAIEFFLSDDGSLKRLGVKTINNQAGVTALGHDLATQSDVYLKIRTGGATREGTRDALAARRDRPPIATDILRACPIYPIIRGHELRTFVEQQKAEDRYREVGEWLGFDPLVKIQKNLRDLRQAMRARVNDETVFRQLKARAGTATAGQLKDWSEGNACNYLNANLDQLNADLKVVSLSTKDDGYLRLKSLASAETSINPRTDALRRLKAIDLVLGVEQEPESSLSIDQGALIAFESACGELRKSLALECEARDKAADAVFEQVWTAAKRVLTQSGDAELDCPLCLTPFANTPLGSAEQVRVSIDARLEDLREYSGAVRQLANARTAIPKARADLDAGLNSISHLLEASHDVANRAIEQYRMALQSWEEGAMLSSEDLHAALTALRGAGVSASGTSDSPQALPFSEALQLVDKLIEIHESIETASRKHRELETVANALDALANSINKDIREKVSELLDSLQEPVNRIYKAIQGDAAVPVRLELPPEGNQNQHRLLLSVDFSEARQAVAPAGYLSDSQVHSLALALRLAAIRLLNTQMPFVVLDDIVTSYDADHRRAIAALLATEMADLQVIITTHDERFYLFMKDQLDGHHWQFTKIVKLDRTRGPRFNDHMVTEEILLARWDRGESAANEMRQAEEEWLLRICRDFGVELRIRDLERAHSYDRAELAAALAGFLKARKLVPPTVPGVASKFLQSIQTGVVENFGSHFQDNPNQVSSIGDERTRWNEFKTFMDQFVCPKCKRTRFQRPNSLNLPLCKNEKCEERFAFVPSQDGSVATE